MQQMSNIKKNVSIGGLEFYEYKYTPSHNQSIDYLVIFLHGYGSNGYNMITLSEYFCDENSNKNLVFLSPNGHQTWEGSTMYNNAFQWFSLANRNDRQGLIKSSIIAQEKISEFIMEQSQKFGVEFGKVILCGFSQGAMLALQYGLNSKNKIAGILAYSGKIMFSELIDKNIHHPKICLIHGEEDDVVQFLNFIEAKKILSEHGIDFKSHAIAGLEHSINDEAIKYGKIFLHSITK